MAIGGMACILRDIARLGPDKVLNPGGATLYGGIRPDVPVLVILAAGKGSRFGQAPKCAQPVCGVPLARHSIDGFRKFNRSPAICVIGYRAEEVMAALGDDNIYVRSDNPTGGTAFAAYESLSVSELGKNPLLIISMGDRIVTPAVFQRLYETHVAGPREADLTLLTAIYEPPRNQGKGRIVRDPERRVTRIIEQQDIDRLEDAALRRSLDSLTEANCPLYAIRAATLSLRLSAVTNDNAQGQFYITDIVQSLSRSGGDIRTITTTVVDPEYDLLTSDVTRPMDLALLEGIFASSSISPVSPAESVEEAARAIALERPATQAESIANQLEELVATAAREQLGFAEDHPVGIGVSGGRLRIAFMHPDMGRFFGPAWQMPIGAGAPDGREQIVIVAQSSDDHNIHLFPTNPQFREKLNTVPADNEFMYPGSEVSDWYTYEGFGTRMAENLLLSLGYFTDEELQARRGKGQPLPPASLWISTNMRRPFSLVGNAIASLRTLRKGNLGTKVQAALGREGFRGIRILSTGNIPQGGFSSSSAVTVATKNAINALFDLRIPPDLLIHLACQAEYGTGVRAGSLDQATEQKGRPGQGTLISSNPRENYRILATYPVPAGRFQLIFPYSVDRDRSAWRWSWGTYAEARSPGRQTAADMRKLTGKAAEIAAFLLCLPVHADFFIHIQEDLVRDGVLSTENRSWICSVLRELPLMILRGELRQRLQENRAWYLEQLMVVNKLDATVASDTADATIDSLLAGWSDPVLRRRTASGDVIEETGVPLRAMVAYLFGEVAKNFHLVHHPDDWIACVSRSQLGDRCFDIDPSRLPPRDVMMEGMDWEKGFSGPGLMERWLVEFGATPFDYNSGLDDGALMLTDPPDFHLLEGTNFFRGLALIDLAEAMLKRAFGAESVAVRVNAAGQGDFFQVHVDTERVQVAAVKDFIRRAFYRRFGLSPDPDFVEAHPGGGAVGVRLSRYDQLPSLIARLRTAAATRR